MDGNDGESVGIAAGFSALVIGIAAALVPFRTELGSANTALILVLVVVAAASLGGRVAGAVVAVVAALSFNFFHTRPYLDLRIHDGRDILTVLLILTVGLAVGELGVARSRQSATRRSHLRSMRALEEVGALVSAGATADEVWPTVRSALVSSLGVRGARFDASVHHALPVIQRDGTVDVTSRRYVGNGFALPATGAVLDVESDGVFLGQIVLLPDAEVGVTREQRRAAVAITDQFAIAVKAAPQAHSFS